MRNVHIVAGTDAARDAMRETLATQKFKVTVGQEASTPDTAALTVIDEKLLGATATDLFVTHLAKSQRPALIILDIKKRGGMYDRGVWHRRQLELDVSPLISTMLEPSDKEVFFSRVRMSLLQSEPARIHVIEDDPEFLADMLALLEASGFQTSFSETFREARVAFQDGPVDALIVDRKLPDGDGLDFIRELRACDILTPTIVVTSWVEEKAILEGIKAGANEYITKPITSNDVFIARVGMALRGREKDKVLCFGALEIDCVNKLTRWRGQPIEGLKRRDQEVLTYLAQRYGLEIPLIVVVEDIWGRPIDERGDIPKTQWNQVLTQPRKRIKEAFEVVGLPDPIKLTNGRYMFDPKSFLHLDLLPTEDQ